MLGTKIEATLCTKFNTIFHSSLNISTNNDYKCSWELRLRKNEVSVFWILLIPAVTAVRKLLYAVSQGRMALQMVSRKILKYQFLTAMMMMMMMIRVLEYDAVISVNIYRCFGGNFCLCRQCTNIPTYWQVLSFLNWMLTRDLYNNLH